MRTIEIRERLRELLDRYRTILSISDYDIGRTLVGEHRIDTGSAHPKRQPLRRQPAPYQAAIDIHVKQMLSRRDRRQ